MAYWKRLAVGQVDNLPCLDKLKALPWWAWGILALAVLGLGVLAAFAVLPPPSSTGLPGSGTISAVSLGVGVLLKLGIVLLLIYTCLFLLKRWQIGALAGLKKQLVVLETTHLSPRQALHLVRLGDQVLLIGATDQSLSCLLQLEGSQVQSRPVEGGGAQGSKVEDLQLLPSIPDPPNFAALLRSILRSR